MEGSPWRMWHAQVPSERMSLGIPVVNRVDHLLHRLSCV